MRTSHDTRVVKRAVAMRMRKFMIFDGWGVNWLMGWWIDESIWRSDWWIDIPMWVVLPRAAETCIYISSSSSSSLSAFFFISLFLSIFLSFCNIFGMLRMYSDSICYESPEVACITGAGTSLRVPGKISVPIVAKHIHLLALFPSLPDFLFIIKSSTLFNLPQNTLSSPKKTLKAFQFLGPIDFISRQIHKKGARGGNTLEHKNKTWLEKYLTPSWRYCTLVNEINTTRHHAKFLDSLAFS